MLFGPEKPFIKLQPAYSVKMVFSYVVKELKIKITAKFRASRRLRFEDTKRIVSAEIRPKSFGTFEKRAPGIKDLKRAWIGDHISRIWNHNAWDRGSHLQDLESQCVGSGSAVFFMGSGIRDQGSG